jgi:hypothetical protein
VTRRNKIASVLLVLILLVLAYQIYGYFRPGGVAVVANAPGQGFVPLPVENPALRLDLLEQLRKFEYQGSRRNIFSAAPLPVEVVEQAAPTPFIAPPVQLPGPPPLAVPAVFFGHVTDARSGTRRAFFSEGDEVYVLGLGDVLLSRFRLVQIGNDTAELEEMSTGRRTTVTMTPPGSS